MARRTNSPPISAGEGPNRFAQRFRNRATPLPSGAFPGIGPRRLNHLPAERRNHNARSSPCSAGTPRGGGSRLLIVNKKISGTSTKAALRRLPANGVFERFLLSGDRDRAIDGTIVRVHGGIPQFRRRCYAILRAHSRHHRQRLRELSAGLPSIAALAGGGASSTG